MTEIDEWVRPADALAMLEPVLSKYSARMRICERAHAGLIRARAEQFNEDERAFQNIDIPKKFWWAEGHEALEQDWAAGDFSTWIDRTIHVKAFGVTFFRADVERLLPPSNSQQSRNTGLTDEDRKIVERLATIALSASASYKQAILDLNDGGRISFRGPALELREALREVLDHLAPDDQVVSAPGYTHEKDRAGPTMKQKVRFIMKRTGKRSSSQTPEQALGAFEESVASLARTVYESSSRATHVASERQVVMQLRRYIIAVFHDLLEL